MYNACKPITVVVLLLCAGYVTEINSEENDNTALISNLTVEATSIQDAPYIVSIELGPYSSGKPYQPVCEGVILTKYLVLSSNMMNFQTPSSASYNLYVRAGSNFSCTGGVVHAVNRVVFHPGYNRSEEFANSAALLVLAKALTFSAAIQPVSLPAFDSTVHEDSALTLYSYNIFRTSSSALLSAQLLSLNQTACEGFFSGPATLPEGISCAIAYGSDNIFHARFAYSSPCVTDNGTLVGLFMFPEFELRPEIKVGVSMIEAAAPTYSNFIRSNLGLLPIFSGADRAKALSWTAATLGIAWTLGGHYFHPYSN